MGGQLVRMALRGSIAAALTLAFATPTVFAHGGGTNAMGCHNERATGGYHCHRTPAERSYDARREAYEAQLELERRRALIETVQRQLGADSWRNPKSLSPPEALMYG